MRKKKEWAYVREDGPNCLEAQLLWPREQAVSTARILAASPLQWSWDTSEGGGANGTDGLGALGLSNAEEFVAMVSDSLEHERSVFLYGASAPVGSQPPSVDDLRKVVSDCLRTADGPLQVVIEQLGDLASAYVFVRPKPSAVVLALLRDLGIDRSRLKEVPYERLHAASLEVMMERRYGIVPSQRQPHPG